MTSIACNKLYSADCGGLLLDNTLHLDYAYWSEWLEFIGSIFRTLYLGIEITSMNDLHSQLRNWNAGSKTIYKIPPTMKYIQFSYLGSKYKCKFI